MPNYMGINIARHRARKKIQNRNTKRIVPTESIFSSVLFQCSVIIILQIYFTVNKRD